MLGGFDIDVAQAVANRLGASADLRPLEPSEILVGKDGWQVALPSGQVPAVDASRFLATAPYYRWPSYLVAAESVGAPSDITALDGRTLGVAAGSAGQSWLDMQVGTTGRIALVPAPHSTARVLADDAACVADLLAGGSDAMVTSTMLSTDVATNPSLLVGSAPVVEDRAMLVPANAPGAAALRDELNRILDSLRADGTLANFARSRFGGEVMTAPKP